VNSEAIKGTRPWKIYGEGPSTEVRKIVAYQLPQVKPDPTDIRFATTGEALYAIAMGWPADGKLLIKSLAENSTNYPRQIFLRLARFYCPPPERHSPGLWIIGGQEFDNVEPVLLVLPERLEIVFVLRFPRPPDHLFPKFCLRTRNTQTIHSLSVPSYSLLLFTGHYGATGAL